MVLFPFQPEDFLLIWLHAASHFQLEFLAMFFPIVVALGGRFEHGAKSVFFNKKTVS
jgi:hypothetical protein